MWGSSILPTIIGKFHDLRQPLVKVRISNAISFLEGDEFNHSPAAQKFCDVWALVDTGATTTVVDIAIQRELMLPQQGSVPVFFPNMANAEFHPTHTCVLSLWDHYNAGAKLHEWKDWPEVLVFSMESRFFKAVLGMDVLSKCELRIANGLPQMTF